MSTEVQKLGSRIAQLEEMLENLMRTGVGLGHSSFEDGQLNQYSGGQLGGSFGTQYDGSNGAFPLSGPTPPTPRWTDKFGPVAEGIVGGVRARWEGYFEGGDLVVATMDHKEVEVHVSDRNDLDGITFDTLKTTITSARGGEVLIPLPVNTDGYYLRLRVRTHSGKASAPSTVIGPFYAQKIREEDLGFNLADLQGTQIFWGDTAPETDAIGDLWLKLPMEEAYRYGPTGWALVPDQESVVGAMKEAIGDKLDTPGDQKLTTGDALTLVATARSLASAAQESADAASSDAAAAAGLAQTAQDTADGKITVYRQASVPSGGGYGLNDLWIDTDANNMLFAWSGGSWVAVDDQRIATALATANGKTTVFAQASAPATSGRTNGDIWIDTDDGNKQYVWDGAWTARTFGVSAIAATARQLGAITIYKQASAPSSGMLTGDYWLDDDDGNKPYRYSGTAWQLVQDQAVVSAINNAATAQATADGKARIFVQITAPTGLVAGDVGDIWIDTDDDNVTYTWDGAAWQKRQISNGAIKPSSIIAKDVIATGTVSAALLEAVLVLATTIIAGDPDHTHVKIKSDGVYVYADDTVDGIPNEVIRMGTASNDFFGITDEDGVLITSLDDTGGVNGSRGNFREDVVVKGRSIYSLLSDVMGGNVTPGATCWYGFAAGMINGVTTELGLIEMSVEVNANRRYLLMFDVGYNVPDASTEVYFRVRDGGTGTPTINSSLIMVRQNHFARNSGWDTTMNAFGVWSPDVTGTHRLLMTAQANSGKSLNVTSNAGTQPTLIVVDLGPKKPQLAMVNRGGGSTAPPTRQYDTGEMGPSGWATYRGDLSQRTDTSGPVQGWDPSGYNGNGKGYWWFPVPNITGTVDRVDVYLYSEHWYYNSGGTARLNLVPTAQGGANFGKLRGDWDVGGWPKPGGRWITLPADWWPFFKNGQANGISVGPGPGTDLNWYGRFTGNAARLRIWYTQ